MLCRCRNESDAELLPSHFSELVLNNPLSLISTDCHASRTVKITDEISRDTSGINSQMKQRLSPVKYVVKPELQQQSFIANLSQSLDSSDRVMLCCDFQRKVSLNWKCLFCCRLQKQIQNIYIRFCRPLKKMIFYLFFSIFEGLLYEASNFRHQKTRQDIHWAGLQLSTNQIFDVSLLKQACRTRLESLGQKPRSKLTADVHE